MNEKKKEVYSWGNAEISISSEGLPKKVYMELSSRCNFSCPGCFRNSFDDEGQDLPEALFEKIVQSVKPEGIREVVLGGIGEPLLHPGFRQLVTDLTGRGAAVTLQTNGALLDDSLIDFLVDRGLERVVLSYEAGTLGHAAEAAEGKTENSAASLPGFPGEHIRKLRKARQKAKTNRPLMAVEWVLSTDSIPMLEDFAEAAIAFGVEEVLFSNLLPTSAEMNSSLLYPARSDESASSVLAPFIEKVRHRLHYSVPLFLPLTERHCRFIEHSSAVIRSDGSVVPCYRFLHDGKEIVLGKEMELHAAAFGSLLDSSLEDIWNGRDYIWFRYTVENALYPSCVDCTLRDGCEYLRDSDGNCWGGSPSCGNCLWSRSIIMCP